MNPQVGQVYDTTKAWNLVCRPRQITKIDQYRVYYHVDGHSVHELNISIGAFHNIVHDGSWILRVPFMLRLPVGA